MITRSRKTLKPIATVDFSVPCPCETASIESLRDQILDIMNKTLDYTLLSNLSNFPDHIRKEAEQASIAFHNDSKRLSLLLQQYRSSKETDKCLSRPNDIIEELNMKGLLNDSLTEEEEAEEAAQSTPSKYALSPLLKKKPKIEDFVEEGFNSLPTYAQTILEQHREDIFVNTKYYQEQIEMVISLVYEKGRKSKCGCTAIGKLFGITRGAVQSHVTRSQKQKQQFIGRPGVLSHEEREILILHIECQAKKMNPLDIHMVIDFIYDKFKLSIKHNTLWKMLHRDERLKLIKGIPMENVRVEASIDKIKEHYDRLSSVFESEKIHPAFVFNVDETGFQSFADAKELTLVVPVTFIDKEGVYPVNRSSKRATMIGCISLNGTALKPCVITSNKTKERSLNSMGYHDDNVLIISQESGFVNIEAFAYWADMVFFPEVRRRRIHYKYEGTCVLMLDGCTSHFCDYFLDECSYNNVYPFQEPSGSSDQVQPLDLGIFGAQKATKPRCSTKHKELSENSKNIIEIVDSWHRVTTPSNIVSAFNQAGIFVIESDEGPYTSASIEFARAVRGIEHKPCSNVVLSKKTEKLQCF